MSPTTTGAMASGSDAVETDDPISLMQIAQAAMARACLATRDCNLRASRQIVEGAIYDALIAAGGKIDPAAAALAAPAPVVPEEMRAKDGWIADEPTPEMYAAARDWSKGKYGMPIGNEAARGCWQAMLWHAPVDLCALAATPSKPVGDGGEASAPPAGGGAVGEVAALLEAGRALIAAEQKESEAAAHFESVATASKAEAKAGTLKNFDAMRAASDQCSIALRARQGAQDAFRSALDGALAVAPAAPEPAAGGEREILARIVDEWDGSETGVLSIETVRAARSLLSAPTGAETAGGDGWCFDMEAAPRDGSDVEIVNDRGQFIAQFDETWHGGGWWMVSDGKDPDRPLRGDEPFAWRVPTKAPPKPTPANAGAEGGQA